MRSPSPKTIRRSHRKLISFLLLGMAAIVVAAIAVVSSRGPHEGGLERAVPVVVSQGVAAPARRESRPTLDPGRFTGKAATAYQVAREIPDVLDQLRCYCACDSQYGHVSLLSCYTDGHAST